MVTSEFFGRKVKDAEGKKSVVFPREFMAGGFSEIFVDSDTPDGVAEYRFTAEDAPLLLKGTIIRPNGQLIRICTNCSDFLHPKFYLRSEPCHGIHFNVRCYPCVRMHQASDKHNKDKLQLRQAATSPEEADAETTAFELKCLDEEESALSQYIQDVCSVGYPVSPNEKKHLWQRIKSHPYLIQASPQWLEHNLADKRLNKHVLQRRIKIEEALDVDEEDFEDDSGDTATAPLHPIYEAMRTHTMNKIRQAAIGLKGELIYAVLSQADLLNYQVERLMVVSNQEAPPSRRLDDENLSRVVSHCRRYPQTAAAVINNAMRGGVEEDDGDEDSDEA